MSDADKSGTERLTNAASHDVVIRVRENGPLLVTGPVTVVDHLGNKFDASGRDNIALCRCGASYRKPFCDGTHKTNGFVATDSVSPCGVNSP